MSKHTTCECNDPECPECGGECHNTAVYVLYRINTEDSTGNIMCEACAMDALESGLFDIQNIDKQFTR